jgi:hypothetical protein
MGKAKGSKEKRELRIWEERVKSKNLVALYVGASTVEQETDLQERQLLGYCGPRGWESILCRERRQSGTKQNRPGLTSLLRWRRSSPRPDCRKVFAP